MKQQRKTKLISLLLSLVLLLSALGVGSASANGLFAGGEGPVIANLSLKDGVGYYMLDNQLYRYTAADGASAAVSELPASAFTDASYVLYDGETVYVADERSVVRPTAQATGASAGPRPAWATGPSTDTMTSGTRLSFSARSTPIWCCATGS